MIELKEQYYLPVGQSINRFLEKVVLEETKGIALPTKHLGDVQLDEHTLIDVKSIDVAKKFHMPNLSSQKKLFNWLHDEQNTLMYFFIFYEKIHNAFAINSTILKHIEEIHPDCLVVQAQGLGVLQIKNMHKLKFVDKMSRKEWLKVLRVKVEEYYDKEELKIAKGRKFINDNYSD